MIDDKVIEERLRIEYIPLSKAVLWAANPKLHDQMSDLTWFLLIICLPIIMVLAMWLWRLFAGAVIERWFDD